MTPGESKSLIRFPPAQVAPLQLQVIPPTKEHAASHQSRCLSIGLHPHPAPSSPSGSIISITSIISIGLHHFHQAPSSPSGSHHLYRAPSSPSGSITSIIPIQPHHLHQVPLPPSSSIISTGLHHLYHLHHPHMAPSSPSSSITSIISIGFHQLHQVPSPPSSSIISIGLHHHHLHPDPHLSPSSLSGSIIPIWLPASPSGSIISIGLYHLHRALSGPTVTVTQGGECNLVTREQCHPKWTEDTVSSGGAGEFPATVELC